MKKPRTPSRARVQQPEGVGTKIVSAHWSGPLPPPNELAAFDQIVPGGAERIFKQFEEEGDHRREMEKSNARFLIRDTHVGQLLAGLYAVCAFGVTAYAISRGAEWAAVILGGGTIVGGVVAFLRRRGATSPPRNG